MIHVPRDPCTADALVLKTERPKGTAPTTRAERELVKAIAFYTPAPANAKGGPAPAKKVAAKAGGAGKGSAKAAPTDFTFTVYKDKEIAAQLRSMFFGKCAYCESEYRHVSSTDIEHFRPKAAVEVNGALIKPAYFWLAATWENLYPSCPLCNRVGDYGLANATGTKSGGKGCKFPLDDESKRVRLSGSSLLDEEKVRLLLDPCVDRPEEILGYHDTGMVVPQKGIRALRRRRAEQSILVFGLFRAELVDKRREAILSLEAKIDAVDDSAETYNWMVKDGAPAARVAKRKKRLELEVQALKDLFKPTSPYLGILRFQLRKEIGTQRGKRLKKLGVDLNDFL